MHLLIFLFILTGCTTVNKDFYQGAFVAPYETVWQSVLMAMEYYHPLAVEDVESGQIETKTIHGYSAWKPPEGLISDIDKRRYKIKIFLEKGQIGSKQAIKIHIIKDETLDKSFIEHSVSLISSGIEEEVLLYRIQRNVLMENRKNQLKKQKRLKKQQSEKKSRTSTS